MRQITKDLNTLEEKDLITIILYCIYKFTQDPNYATISELAYTLDKDSLYKLCSTFGGTTIKVPTLREYRNMVKVMLIFDYVNSDGLTFSEASEKAGVTDDELDSVTEMYSIMLKVLETYDS